MNTILITGIGGDIGQAVATILRELIPDSYLIGTDIHSRHGGTLFVDEFILAPSASAKEYINWVGDLIDNRKVNICIPLSEAELLRIANEGETKFSEQLLMPTVEAIRIGADKLETARFLNKIGCPAPWTIAAEKLGGDVQFPCIFKPRRGAGSKGVFVCESVADVQRHLDHYPCAVLQELLLPADKEVTCAVYRTTEGKTGVIQMLRELAGDVTGWVEVIDNDAIRLQCELIAKELDLKGAINVQLRLTESGPRIFEINPRFSSTVLIRHKMGFKDVVWAIKEMMGERVDTFIPPAGLKAVRTHGASVI